MNYLLNTVELALFLMFPLVLFYKRSSWKFKNYFFDIVFLYLIWYSTYSLFHEFCHMIGIWLTGKEIIDYKLIPKFWKGELGGGYINYDFIGEPKDFLIIVMPYVRDIVMLFIGIIILRKKHLRNSFIIGFVLILFIFSSLYDIINNYSAYVFGSLNDFNALKVTTNSIFANLIGITFSLSAALVTFWVVKHYKGYPLAEGSKFESPPGLENF